MKMSNVKHWAAVIIAGVALAVAAGCTAVNVGIDPNDGRIVTLSYRYLLQDKNLDVQKTDDGFRVRFETNSDPAVALARMAFEAGKQAGAAAAVPALPAAGAIVP